MSEDVNILANLATFDAVQSGHIGHIGKFHDLDNIQGTARSDRQRNKAGVIRVRQRGMVLSWA